MTALIGLEVFGSIQEEDIVLVNVGIGGIGLAAVDIAANIYRAKVFTIIIISISIYNLLFLIHGYFITYY